MAAVRLDAVLTSSSLVPCTSSITEPLLVEAPPAGASAPWVPLALTPSTRVVGQAAPEEILASSRAPTSPVRGPTVVTTSVLKKAVRGIPATDLPTITAIPNVARRLKAQIRGLRLLPTPSDGPAMAVATPIMARPDEVTTRRGPVVPTAMVAAGLTRRIAVAWVPTPRPDAGPFPVPSTLLRPEAGPAAVETTKGGPSPVPTPTKEEVGPLPVEAPIVRAAPTNPSRVAVNRPTGPLLTEATPRQVPILARRRGVPSAAFPLLTRQTALKVGLKRRDIELLT